MRSQKQIRRAPSPPASRQGNAPPPVLFHELIVEILSWLPVKSLLRFRCVCKSWNSLISDPQFVKMHLRRSAANASFAHLRLTPEDNINDSRQRRAISCSVRSLLDNPSSAIAETEEHSYWLKDKYGVVGSSNGLLCLIGLFIGELFEEFWARLWNPATRLRSEQSPRFYVDWRSDRFGFTKFGFGYDHLTGTYKVVAVIFDHSGKEESEKTLVKVHSMGDDCWRNIESFPAVPAVWQNDGEFLRGTLNWIAVRNSSGYKWKDVTNDQLLIVSLDLGTETYRKFLLPHVVDEAPHVEPALGVLRDCLCVAHDYKGTRFVVWQMKEFGVEKSWTQLVNVSSQDLQIDSLKFPSLLPLCMSENGDVLMMSYSFEWRAILYNRRDNRLEHPKIPNNTSWIHAKVYAESLVLPCWN